MESGPSIVRDVIFSSNGAGALRLRSQRTPRFATTNTRATPTIIMTLSFSTIISCPYGNPISPKRDMGLP